MILYKEHDGIKINAFRLTKIFVIAVTNKERESLLMMLCLSIFISYKLSITIEAKYAEYPSPEMFITHRSFDTL